MTLKRFDTWLTTDPTDKNYIADVTDDDIDAMSREALEEEEWADQQTDIE